MSLQHHGGSANLDVIKRFIDQVSGTAKREYPAGRMGAEDDGVLSYAITNDDRHQTIVIRFGKPVEWVGMDLQAATQLRDELTERIMALRGIEASV